MSSRKSKLRLTGAFAALATLALAVSCHGFFVNPTLTSISISPSTPQVALSQTSQVQLWGNYNDGSRNQVRSGVSWTTEPQNIVTIDPGGNMTGIALGTTTVSGTAQGLTPATATATVFLTNVQKIQINPGSWGFSFGAGGAQAFNAVATYSDKNGVTQTVDISTIGAVWTVSPTTTGISCVAGTNEEDCTAATSSVTAGPYTLTASYPGTTIVGTAAITVTP
jgi:hypothetical protein